MSHLKKSAQPNGADDARDRSTSPPDPGKVTLTSRLPTPSPSASHGGALPVQRRSISTAPSIPPASVGLSAASTDDFVSNLHFGPPIQRRGGNQAAVEETSTPAIAAKGVSGASESLPHGEQIAESFGPAHRDTILGIQSQTGGEAASAATAIGAQAYATGNRVAFASTPDLHTAAHEAAHVVQQQSGVQLKGGVGQSDDPYERHADAVADRVVSGQSAAPLLVASQRNPSGEVVQRKSSSGAEAPRNRPAQGSPHEIQMPPAEVGGDALAMPPMTMGAKVGDPYIDEGMACDRDPTVSGCALNVGQRTRLTQMYEARVGRSLTFMTQALEELRTEILLTKDTEAGLSFLAALMLDLIGGVFLHAISHGADALRENGEHALDEIAKAPAEATSSMRLTSLFAKLPTRKIELATEAVVGASKATVEEAAKPQVDASERSAVTALIDSVSAQLPTIYQVYQETLPAEFENDAMLILAWKMFDPAMGHTKEAYKSQLENKIARFKISGITELGSKRMPDLEHFENKQAKWTKRTGEKRLGLFTATTLKPNAQGGVGRPVEWEFETLIDPEFEDVAIKLQTARWGSVEWEYQDNPMWPHFSQEKDS